MDLIKSTNQRTTDRHGPEETARPETIDLIRAAGLQLIYERGYEGMGLRHLAAIAGIGQSTLYGHFATKQDLLIDLIGMHMGDLLASLRLALPPDAPPLRRFLAFVHFHLDYHTRRHREVFICYSEMRSLEPENYHKATEWRREYEHVLIDIIAQGVESGVMRRVEPRVAAYGVLAMLSGMQAWYRQDGPLTYAEVSDNYVRLAVASVLDPVNLAMQL